MVLMARHLNWSAIGTTAGVGVFATTVSSRISGFPSSGAGTGSGYWMGANKTRIHASPAFRGGCSAGLRILIPAHDRTAEFHVTSAALFGTYDAIFSLTHLNRSRK
ncbi:hypothetical protein B0H11DRAFT_2020860 [Mycena galericulata]|nr:hypothetical protein B0H11DRAFT_2020860 [Mycena galericulata]